MREELISLLEEAFEAGVVTSTVHVKIEILVQKLGMTEEEYRTIEDEIRINAYIKKVKEREKKGITFMGDLRKQYHITDDDRVVIQEKLSAASKKQSAPKQSPAQSKKQEAAAEPEKPVVSKKQEPAPAVEKNDQTDVIKRSEKLKEAPPQPGDGTEKRVPEKKKAEKPKPLIVIADDNETQLFLTRSALEESGYACATADSPESAVKIASELKPVMVICDVNFGIGRPTGMDVFNNIRAKGLNMPFIIMSAFIQKEFKEHAKRIGVTEYITKPTDVDQLIAVIKKYIK
jgi:CheY-like chemotaxis protein